MIIFVTVSVCMIFHSNDIYTRNYQVKCHKIIIIYFSLLFAIAVNFIPFAGSSSSLNIYTTIL